jgi:GNAT superfamily N-acetyltransferase
VTGGVTGGVTIRPIADHEVDALSRITVDVYTALWPGLLPDDYLAELADVRGRVDEALVLVAVDDGGEVLGGIAYVDRAGRWASIDGHQAELRMLAVTPEAQGRGVGTGLVQACIDQARLDGKHQVLLHTAESMKTAQRIYERARFRRHPGRDVAAEGICLFSYVLDLDG